MDKIVIPCPECAKNGRVGEMIIRINRSTDEEFLGCSNYPRCTHTMPLPEHIKLRKAGAEPLPGF